MGGDTDQAERIAVLETKVDILNRSVESLSKDVKELLAIVQQVQGARYALAVGGGVIGVTVAWIFSKADMVLNVFRAIK
jgi:hypothetical protein